MLIGKGPKRILNKAVEQLVRSLKTADKAVSKLGSKTVNTLLDLDAAGGRTKKRASQATVEATINLYRKIINFNINEGDMIRGSTPLKQRLQSDFDTSKIDSVLEKLDLKAYDEKDAVDYMNEDLEYWKMTDGFLDLGGKLENFGVSNSAYGKEKFASSLAHKDLIRNYMGQISSKKLPEAEKQRNKVVAFQAYVFANAKLLLGPVEYQQKRYQSYISDAVKNENIVPLILMKELAGIDLKTVFRNENAYQKLIKKADKLENQKIAQYLNTQSIEETFPELH